jgi:hypothetical protein
VHLAGHDAGDVAAGDGSRASISHYTPSRRTVDCALLLAQLDRTATQFPSGGLCIRSTAAAERSTSGCDARRRPAETFDVRDVLSRLRSAFARMRAR